LLIIFVFPILFVTYNCSFFSIPEKAEFESKTTCSNNSSSSSKILSSLLSSSKISSSYFSSQSNLQSSSSSSFYLSNSNSNGLISEYLFSGNANDTSGNGLNGTVVNATLTTDRKSAYSAYLFGNGNRIDLPTNLLSSANAFAVSGWFRLDKDSANSEPKVIIDLRANGQYQIWFSYQDWNPAGSDYQKLQFCTNDNTSTTRIYSPVISKNTWYHFVIQYDGSKIYFYLNSILVDSASANTPGISSSTEIRYNEIGIDYARTEGRGFNGAIDNVRLYNKALTDQEVLNLYNE
jgi:trimeric autotransporter adhesin